ncbi:MAG: restriction endonuclease subunit S [Sutterella parvirubra]|nr:restriction endonuclease subunit S [Sutterella parvirubra]MDY5201393.1 restriction endonuclease subunit S [Sutterella parvirubra]
MNFDVMRRKLLERALSGRLVPQLDDEPEVEQVGEALGDQPFKIPEKWKWVQLTAIGKIVGGGTPKTNIETYWQGGTINWFTPADLGEIKGKFARESSRKITQGGLRESSAKLMPAGSVLFSSRAPIGHIAISTTECCTNQGCKSFVPDFDKISTDWGYYTIHGLTEEIKSRASGTTFKEISTKEMGKTWIPLPPIEEQNRIVAKLKNALGLIDKAEKAYSELEGPLSDRFRSLCLERAIKGALVPQLNDEPAAEQIGEVPEDIPFSIPEKWKWVQLKAIGTIVGGGTPKTNIESYWSNGTINWFTPADLGEIQGDYAIESTRKITPDGLKESSAKLMPPGSILFSSRAPIGYIAISTTKCCTNQGCKSFVPNLDIISTEWAYYAILALTDEIKSRASGTTFKEISGKEMGKTWVPLPPLKEQRRIVEKLYALFKDLDRLTG